MLRWFCWVGIASSFGICLSAALPAVGQISPDLTTDTSVRRETRNDFRIEGGTQQGQNLFHSFRQFNVPEGSRVTLADPGVENILMRVTGNTRSAIDGTLAVDGNANLFLMNPHGITFGENAALSLNGSFLATTANAIRFGNQGLFSATEPQSPGLLTVNPSAFLFNQLPHGTIVNRARIPIPLPEGQIGEYVGLRVPDGNSLVLLGGTVEAGHLNAFGGRIEVGGVEGEATVGLRSSPTEGLQLNFNPQTQRADVSLLNGAQISVGGGDLAIWANTLQLNGQAYLSANAVRSEIDPEGSRIGNINIHAQDQIILEDGSFIAGQGLTSETSGEIVLQADRAIIVRDSFISTETFSRGNGGKIQITTPSLELSNNSRISASAQSNASAGSIIIDARQVELDWAGIIAVSDVGEGGNITITNADRLLLARQSRIATTAGRRGAGGNGGNITLNAQFIVADPFSNSDIAANAFTGNGGNVNISGDQIFGLQFRPNETNLSDITVSSRFGAQGTVRINGIEADPSRGLTPLPTTPTDATTQIARTCSTSTVASSFNQFVITGRGGLPPNPTEPIGSSGTLVGWARLEGAEEQGNQGAELGRSPSVRPAAQPLVEAQGWVVDADGQVNLVTDPPIAPAETDGSSVLSGGLNQICGRS